MACMVFVSFQIMALIIISGTDPVLRIPESEWYPCDDFDRRRRYSMLVNQMVHSIRPVCSYWQRLR